jgi:hypothetical protein
METHGPSSPTIMRDRKHIAGAKWPRRNFRRQAATMLRSCIVEWQRPDPQGAPVRAYQSEGNHGEDVKEYYFYLDSTPTHSYMKFLYKYPQSAYPYTALVDRRRSRNEFEYEFARYGCLQREPLL